MFYELWDTDENRYKENLTHEYFVIYLQMTNRDANGAEQEHIVVEINSYTICLFEDLEEKNDSVQKIYTFLVEIMMK